MHRDDHWCWDPHSDAIWVGDTRITQALFDREVKAVAQEHPLYTARDCRFTAWQNLITRAQGANR